MGTSLACFIELLLDTRWWNELLSSFCHGGLHLLTWTAMCPPVIGLRDWINYPPHQLPLSLPFWSEEQTGEDNLVPVAPQEVETRFIELFLRCDFYRIISSVTLKWSQQYWGGVMSLWPSNAIRWALLLAVTFFRRSCLSVSFFLGECVNVQQGRIWVGGYLLSWQLASYIPYINPSLS